MRGKADVRHRRRQTALRTRRCRRRRPRLPSPDGGSLVMIDHARVQVGILPEPLDELLDADALGNLDAVHLEDVLLARANLDDN